MELQPCGVSSHRARLVVTGVVKCMMGIRIGRASPREDSIPPLKLEPAHLPSWLPARGVCTDLPSWLWAELRRGPGQPVLYSKAVSLSDGTLAFVASALGVGTVFHAKSWWQVVRGITMS